MKKTLFISAGLALCAVIAQAQTINFSNGKVTYSFPAEVAGEMAFAGETVTVADRQFNLAEWSQIAVNNAAIEANTVDVRYAGGAASVIVAGNIARYVDVTVDGAHVSVTQSDMVSDATCGEITYVLAGKSADGSLLLNGSYKSTLELRGLNLTNPSGAALDIKNGKRIALSAKNGTVNTLTDGSGSQKGAIECKGHLELKGKGELTVRGTKSHAIYAKEYIEIKNLTLNVTGAVKDGINCGQYFTMESGNVTVTGTGDDGIQASFKDDADREPEDTGTLTVSGGKLTVEITADAAKCLKADGDVVVSGGTLNLTTNANGIWDSAKSKT
ncbi:MAG: carbohydrate-binding domain-containing protein, partial [Duncaniella sp.]|nr:carbohydrate-binding domain-containing protein [Duncaniella sp.]